MTIAGATACADCGVGKYLASTGNNAESDCVQCEAGTYVTAPGAACHPLCLVSCMVHKLHYK